MKPQKLIRILLTSMLGLLPWLSNGQHSCCSANATAQFAMLGKDKDFQASHLAPVPFNFVPSSGTEITFEATDGTSANAYQIKTQEPSNKVLLIFHEWWGLNDYIKREAERIAGQLPGVNVIALDLYDGKTAADAENAGKLMSSVKQEHAEAIIKGILNYVGNSAQIQTIGWCFGGGWSLQASILAGKQGKGCVMYYGMPEKDNKRLESLNGPVLGIFADKDGWINHEVVGAFEKQMSDLKKPLSVSWYKADHAFANPSNPKYDKSAAEDANKKAIAFLKQNFK